MKCNLKTHHWIVLVLVIAAGFGAVACTQGDRGYESKLGVDEVREKAMPHSLLAEHQELFRQLEAAIKSGGETGSAAKLVGDRLRPHFAKEEEFALPPLVRLPQLAQEKTVGKIDETIQQSAKLRTELPQMLNEHKAIILALDQLEVAARNENKRFAIDFAEGLRHHAQTEEEILYPAAILVGEYQKLRMRSGEGSPDNSAAQLP